MKLKFLLFYFFLNFFSNNFNFEIKKPISGKDLFEKHCSACHSNGNNSIIPEKNLFYKTLEENGMNKIESINYQILNGKNGMPAFGGRLNEDETNNISIYILEKSLTNFDIK